MLLVLMSILLVLMLTGCCLSHEWEDATCSAAKTCVKCEKTDGEPLPHTFSEATCTTPKTCSVCGTTEGDTLEHTWADADCTNPKTCLVCMTTEGEPLGHNWEDATCSVPKTCSFCAATEGNTLEHDFIWTTTKEPHYSSTGEKEGVCSVCGECIVEVIEKLVPEYHWNQPVEISSEYTIGMYNDGTNYWIEITAQTNNTDAILFMLRNGTADLGFDVDEFLEWAQHVANGATNSWKSNGITYAEMSGYGREWVVYMDLRDDMPGVIGLKVNMEKEFEAVIGVDIAD